MWKSLAPARTVKPIRPFANVGILFETGAPCDAIEHPLTKVPIFSEDFEAFGANAAVTATEEAGEIVGKGRLEAGTWVKRPTGTAPYHVCEMPFSVDAKASDFYTLGFGELESDPITADEVAEPVELTFKDSDSPLAF